MDFFPNRKMDFVFGKLIPRGRNPTAWSWMRCLCVWRRLWGFDFDSASARPQLIDVTLRVCECVIALLLTVPYVVALTAGVTEYAVESRLVPQFKALASISYVGLVLVIAGEVIRKLAIVTAQSNFTHDIKVSREDGHQLVTHGIYRQGSRTFLLIPFLPDVTITYNRLHTRGVVSHVWFHLHGYSDIFLGWICVCFHSKVKARTPRSTLSEGPVCAVHRVIQ